MVPKQKTYYTYISFDEHCNFYLGSASCYGNPEDHNYFGSGKAIASGEFVPVRKRIINIYDSRGLAGKAEKTLIALADPRNNPVCFNRYCQGSNQGKISQALTGKKLSEAHKAKISEALSGENHPNYGKSHSEETRSKISEAMAGKIASEETRSKISQAMCDARLHKFVHSDGREIVGLFYELKANAESLFGFSASSVRSLKIRHKQCIKGWSYYGVIGNE